MSKASLSRVAQHFGISRTAARDLEIQNVINRTAGLDSCRLAYIRHLRERHSRRNGSNSHLREARAREIEVRTAQRLGKLVPLEDFDAFVDELCGIFRTELSGLPARVTRDLMLRRTVEQEITVMLHRVSARSLLRRYGQTRASPTLPGTTGSRSASCFDGSRR